jgi:hypothetical protein
MAELVSDLKYMNADVVLDGGFKALPMTRCRLDQFLHQCTRFPRTMYPQHKYIHWRPTARGHGTSILIGLQINQDAMVRLIGWQAI